MALGVLYNFTGNSNVSRITPASQMVKQPWFLEAVNFTEPIDLFILAVCLPYQSHCYYLGDLHH